MSAPIRKRRGAQTSKELLDNKPTYSNLLNMKITTSGEEKDKKSSSSPSGKIERAKSYHNMASIENENEEPKTLNDWFNNLDYFISTKDAHVSKRASIIFNLKQFTRFSPKDSRKNSLKQNTATKKNLEVTRSIIQNIEEFIQHINNLLITKDKNCLDPLYLIIDNMIKNIRKLLSSLINKIKETIIKELCTKTLNIIEDFNNLGVSDHSTIQGLSDQRSSFISHVIITLQRHIDNQLLQIRSFSNQIIGNIATQNILLFCASIQTLFKYIEDILTTISTIKDLLNLKAKKEDNINIIDNYNNDTIDNDINIWEEDLNKEKPEGTGTLNSLVANLTSTTNYESNYTKSFIMTYQAFTKPFHLLQKLKQRFIDIPDSIPDSVKSQIELRICIVLKYWIETRIFDFDSQILHELELFLRHQVKQKNSEMAKRLLNTIDKSIQNYKQVIQSQKLSILSSKTLDKYFTYSITQSSLIFDFSPSTIAKQLTLMDCEMLKRIEVVSFLNQSWSKSNLKYRALSLIYFIERLDKYSYWIATLLLSKPLKVDRVELLQKLLEIADDLLQVQNNFHAVAGFVVGFNLAAVSRLKHTFNDISRKHKQILENLNTFMNPHSSYATYRQTLHSKTLPVIPFIGVYLSDLTFIDEGNPNMIDGFINFQKYDMVYNALREVIVFQQSKYTGDSNLLLQNYLSALPSLDEKILYDLSLEYEPRGVDVSEIK